MGMKEKDREAVSVQKAHFNKFAVLFSSGLLVFAYLAWGFQGSRLHDQDKKTASGLFKNISVISIKWCPLLDNTSDDEESN